MMHEKHEGKMGAIMRKMEGVEGMEDMKGKGKMSSYKRILKKKKLVKK